MVSKHTSNRLLFVWLLLNLRSGRQWQKNKKQQFFIHQISVRSLVTASMCKEKTAILFVHSAKLPPYTWFTQNKWNLTGLRYDSLKMFVCFSQKWNKLLRSRTVHDRFQNQEERPLLDNINNNRQHSRFLFFFFLLKSIKMSECAEHRKTSFRWSLHTVCFGREWCFWNSTVNKERFSSCYVREYAGITPVKWFSSCHVYTLIRKIMCYWSFFFFSPSYVN